MDVKLRRQRVFQGRHRAWEVVPRIGTDAERDRWTFVGAPIPGGDNPAADYEDGQYPDLESTYRAVLTAERLDDGTSWED